jgi:uncharacterized protein (DUF1697 family)
LKLPMALHLALLRGINVGGNQKVAMADLRGIFAPLGLGNARSVLQSGNLVFESDGRTAAQLESLLEAEARRRLGLTATWFVRTAREWKAVVAANPFAEAAKNDPSHLLVLFLKQAPAPPAVRALQAAVVGREEIRVVDRQAYITYPDGIGQSRLTPAILDGKLGQRGTGRNWNTVLKLAALPEG